MVYPGHPYSYKYKKQLKLKDEVGMTVLRSTQTRFVSHPLYIPTLAFLVYHDQRIPTLIAMILLAPIDVHQPVNARIPFEVFLTLCLSENSPL